MTRVRELETFPFASAQIAFEDDLTHDRVMHVSVPGTDIFEELGEKFVSFAIRQDGNDMGMLFMNKQYIPELITFLMSVDNGNES